MGNRPAPKTIHVIGTKYDGSPRDEWSAQLIEERGTQLRVHVPAGTEEIVRGHRRHPNPAPLNPPQFFFESQAAREVRGQLGPGQASLGPSILAGA